MYWNYLHLFHIPYIKARVLKTHLSVGTASFGSRRGGKPQEHYEQVLKFWPHIWLLLPQRQNFPQPRASANTTRLKRYGFQNKRRDFYPTECKNLGILLVKMRHRMLERENKGKEKSDRPILNSSLVWQAASNQQNLLPMLQIPPIS